MRPLAALGFVVLIALAATLLGETRGTEYRAVVQAEIDQNGDAVPLGGVVADPAGTGGAFCPPVSIAMAGVFTGVNAQLGLDTRNGVQLAIGKHNAANPGCQVQIKEFDTKGDPAAFSTVAPQIVADAYTLGLIGPTFSGVAQQTGAVFDASGMPAATASASSSALSQQGWTTFFRAVASDEVQGRAVANYLRRSGQFTKICLVSDRSEYGAALAQAASTILAERLASGCTPSLTLEDKQFDSVVGQIRAAGPDLILHVGESVTGAELIRHLRTSGVSADFASAQNTNGGFIGAAADSAIGAVLSCPCGPIPPWFGDDYRRVFGQEPGAYSVEGYDLATIMLNGIDAGRLVRPQMLDWMRNYNGEGVARRYRWTPTGELTNPTVWIYKVQ